MNSETMQGYQLDHLQQIQDLEHHIPLIERNPAADPVLKAVVKGYRFGAAEELKSEGFGDIVEKVVFDARKESSRSPEK